MAKPRILYDSRLAGAAPVASTTAAGAFDPANLADWRNYTWWRPDALPATVTGDAASLAYEFTNSADGWVASGLTTTLNATDITLTSTGNNPGFLSPAGLAIDGAANRYVAARIRRTAVGGWDGRMFFTTARHGNDAAYIRDIADPTGGVVGAWVMAVWDMHNLTAGGDDWKKSEITRLRMDLGATATDVFDVDWIAVLPSRAADYAVFWGHDFGTQGVTVEVRGSDDDFSADDNLVATVDPAGDAPFVLEFAAASYRWWRVSILAGASSGTPSLAIAAIGTALELPKGLRQGFDPTGRVPEGRLNRSVKGNPLGRTIDYEAWRQTLDFDLVAWDWIRTAWLPAWDAHLKGDPFIFVWDPAGHPDELRYVQAVKGFGTPHLAGSRTGLKVELEGLFA